MWLNKFVSTMCSACESKVRIIVVMDSSSQWRVCSPFLLCFRTDVTMEIGEAVRVSVNGQLIPFNFHIDDNGYIHLNTPSTEDLRKFDLQFGKNIVEYTIDTPGIVTYASLENEVYIYESFDKLVFNDVDGTLNKSDIQGMYNNYNSNDHLPDNYASMMRNIHSQSYQMVRMTLRSLPMYNMSKEHIRKYVQIESSC
jgi:phosphatidate phosphatase PAH1